METRRPYRAKGRSRLRESSGEGRRGLVIKRGMQSRRAEVLPPYSDGAARMVNAEEQAFVQLLVPHPGVEALCIAVLHRLSGRDVMPLDAMILKPGKDGVRRELDAVVRNHHVWLATTAELIGKLAGDTTTGDRRIKYRSKALARHVVNDVEHPEAPPAGELVMHEVQRPACIRSRLDQDRRVRVPTARRRARRLHTVSPSFR